LSPTQSPPVRAKNELADLLPHAFLRQRYPEQPVFLLGVSYGAAVMLARDC